MYGTMYGTVPRMVKTTVYLPEPLLSRVKRLAAEQGRSEADVIRTALDDFVARNGPRPTLPLFDGEGIPPDLAERDEEYLADGFGRD
jgi:ribbon-helix-helix CopG family protein